MEEEIKEQKFGSKNALGVLQKLPFNSQTHVCDLITRQVFIQIPTVTNLVDFGNFGYFSGKGNPFQTS